MPGVPGSRETPERELAVQRLFNALHERIERELTREKSAGGGRSRPQPALDRVRALPHGVRFELRGEGCTCSILDGLTGMIEVEFDPPPGNDAVSVPPREMITLHPFCGRLRPARKPRAPASSPFVYTSVVELARRYVALTAGGD